MSTLRLEAEKRPSLRPACEDAVFRASLPGTRCRVWPKVGIDRPSLSRLFFRQQAATLAVRRVQGLIQGPLHRLIHMNCAGSIKTVV